MNEKEKQLFKALCKFKDETFDASLLDAATPEVLGHLFFNRMQGIAYYTLKKHDLLGKVSREFRNSLVAAYEHNIEKNQKFINCVEILARVLSSCECNIAMLKGAYLCGHYPDGCRTSNDVDLLVLPKDVSTIGNRLYQTGFMQGNISGGKFFPATRQEIIESKMLRGETVPYIKEVNLSFMEYFEVDINFSLDYKNGDRNILEKMLANSCIKYEKNISIPTLNDSDFFIHLCSHLYKEATTLPWIEMRRDMTLYKYCDIYMLLSEMTDGDIHKIFDRADELGMSKICAYAILETSDLFDIPHGFAYKKAIEALKEDPDFCRKVISPKEKKTFLYQTEGATDRFFLKSRAEDLKEVL